MNAAVLETQPETHSKGKDPMPEAPALNPQKYYRLPWTLNDNGISWLEVTDACNLTCEGCYRPHIDNHKITRANCRGTGSIQKPTQKRLHEPGRR